MANAKTKLALPELMVCPKCKSPGAQLQQMRPDRFWVLCGNPDCELAVSIRWWASAEQTVAVWNGHKLRNVNEAHGKASARLAAERLADRNRRWREAIMGCIIELHCEDVDEAALAAVFDAIASEASCGEIPELLRR